MTRDDKIIAAHKRFARDEPKGWAAADRRLVADLADANKEAK